MTAVLQGAVVAVAGAGGGAGPALAHRLAQGGATVAVADAAADRAEQVAAGVRESGGRADAAAVDLLDAAATRGWAADLLERYGRVDGLVHLVGGWRGGRTLVDSDPADWDALERPLVRTVQRTSQAFHDALLAAPAGRFVLVSSREATRPSQTNAAYAAAKAAAETWTLALADAFDASTAAACIIVVKALLTPAMRADKPDAPFSGYTRVEDLADTIVGLWEQPAETVNGARVWLTEHP
jgi:NAD(P)-dependent dehydrogenase (short-subunit alcohol dehydrogenase family)